ncbi:hypothetical protein QZH41_000967 [Actinostola sp. cb2023]|nr:hypothetical protein QZH41_000967 [Actinostola sp. cb2023]
MFNDCCADLDLYCSAPNDTIPKATRDLWNCHKDIWMIDRCPSLWPRNDVHLKCWVNSKEKLTLQNYLDVIPVVDKDKKTYPNRFCAECNGEKSANLQPYGLDFICPLSPPQGLSRDATLAFLFKHCTNINWKPRKGQPKRECLESKQTCYYPPLVEQCMKKPPRIIFNMYHGVNFRNLYCAMCSLNNPGDLGPLMCGPSGILGPPPPPASFSIIMDIGGHSQGNSANTKVKVECDINEVYDIYLELCRPVSPLPPTPVSSYFDKYRIALWITVSSSSRKLLSSYNSSVIVAIFSHKLGINDTHIQFKKWQPIHTATVQILMLDIQITDKVKRQVRMRRDVTEDINIDSLLNFTHPLKLRWKNDTFTIIKATAKRLTCVNIKYYNPQDYMVLQGSSSIYINRTREVLTEKEYFANHTTKHNDKRIPVGVIAVCRQHILVNNCVNGTYITLENHEYVLLSNKSVYRNVSDTVYNEGDYSTTNGSVVVCSHFSKDYTEKRRKVSETGYDKTLVILTCIGLSLSVICLVATLVTYSLFVELRTLPGINLMNLSSALLVAHFFWLIGSGQNGSHGACVAMAVILHFAFLASFAWMSIIAFSTWKAFSASGGNVGVSNDKEYRRKRIHRALAIGWLPVLFFVMICVALDQSEVVAIQYGGIKGCWINNGRANLYTFVVPIAMSVIWNAVFFGLTVKAIHKARQQARMVTENRANQRNYSVYVKIAVLMGFTWIFGVLGSLVSVYFMYPFVVLSTVQGVYIAGSFTFTHRVANLYKSKFWKSKQPDKRAISSVETKTTESRL